MYLYFFRNVTLLILGALCVAAQESIQYGSISGYVDELRGVRRASRVQFRPTHSRGIGRQSSGSPHLGGLRVAWLSGREPEPGALRLRGAENPLLKERRI